MCIRDRPQATTTTATTTRTTNDHSDDNHDNNHKRQPRPQQQPRRTTNDYHDYKLGVDTIETKPGRPLVTGAVRPESVKFVLKWGYALHLTLLCLVGPRPCGSGF